jgi:asparagine N-glycosylation enzyme membrane subunit Stt3
MVTYQRKGKRVIPLDKEAEESYKIQIYKKMITYEVQVTKNSTTWFINGKLHREDGPAIEGSDGYKAWYINDNWHREDGPAIEHSNGSKYWYINGKLHREDGPAIEHSDGTKEWYITSRRWSSSKEWYINGKRLTESAFNSRLTKTCNGKVIEVDGVKYKLTAI